MSSKAHLFPCVAFAAHYAYGLRPRFTVAFFDCFSTCHVRSMHLTCYLAYANCIWSTVDIIKQCVIHHPHSQKYHCKKSTFPIVYISCMHCGRNYGYFYKPIAYVDTRPIRVKTCVTYKPTIACTWIVCMKSFCPYIYIFFSQISFSGFKKHKMQQQPPPTTVVVTSAPVSDTYPTLNKPMCKSLGIAQIVFGCLGVVLEIILIILAFSSIPGIWVGIFVSI